MIVNLLKNISPSGNSAQAQPEKCMRLCANRKGQGKLAATPNLSNQRQSFSN